MDADKNFLSIKMHFFLFMCAVGPILPYIMVLGKQLGISEVLMGTINGMLPLVYFVAKPLAGYVMDYFPRKRTLIFTSSIIFMTICNASIYFTLPSYNERNDVSSYSQDCTNSMRCSIIRQNTTEVSVIDNSKITENYYAPSKELQSEPTNSVLAFVIFMSVGCTMFTVCNSYTDTICIDILGEGNQMEYGKQRVWGAIGYGITGCLSGVLVDIFSTDAANKNHAPAFVILAIFSVADIAISLKLKPRAQYSSPNILADVKEALKNRDVAWFMFVTLIFGICDSFAVYYLLWYIEDVACTTGTYSKIRSIEGVILLCQTIFGEFVFFQYSGAIIEKIGYNSSFVLCLIGYGVRFGLLSIIPSVWWALPIESVFQGSYALSYTLIVSYTNYISTSGIRATMQSVSMAVFDGFGYAIGSFVGGVCLKVFGGRLTFQLISALCVIMAGLTMIVSVCLRWNRKFDKVTSSAPRSSVM